MPTEPPHPCPGCGRTGIPYHQLACKPCWRNVPTPMRDEVWIAYRKRVLNPDRHRRAIIEAMRWLRAYRSANQQESGEDRSEQQPESGEVDPGDNAKGGQEETHAHSDQQNDDPYRHMGPVPNLWGE